MQDRVSKEVKLLAAKDIVANYLRGAHHKDGDSERPVMTPDEVCQFIKKVYSTIEETVPDTESRKIGLG